MKMCKRNLPVFLGVLITFIYLSVNLYTINEYGITWDFTYHFNAGLWHLKLPQTEAGFVMGPSPPLSDTLPVLTKIFFYDKLHFLNWDAAYNLYSVVLGSLGIGLLYFFVKSVLNWQIALFSSLFLALMPRYLGHLHNNMKDVPQAFFFTLSLFLFWIFYKNQTIRNLLLAAIGFAFAFNSKVNALFIPLIILAYLIMTFFWKLAVPKLKIPPWKSIMLFYFLLLPVFAFCLWSIFWPNPVERLLEASHSYTSSTINMPILYYGQTVYSGVNVPWHYPFGILLATTPVITVFFILFGTLVCLFQMRKGKIFYLFLLLWFFVPIMRYFKPHMIVIDDIRHFLEVIYPLTVLAGIGCYNFFQLFTKFRKLKVPVILTVFGYLFFQIVVSHPYQNNYFSESTGGIKGAQGKFDIEFWCNAYKNALVYVNRFASNGATVIVPMAPDIAKLYIRPDLKINQSPMTYAKTTDYQKGEYTIIMNRESFFSWYGLNEYMAMNKPIYKLTLGDIPLVSVYKN